MNKLKTIDRKVVSWKFLFKIQKVNPLNQFAYHYLDRGSDTQVHNRLSAWQIQHKIHLKLKFFFSAEEKNV